MKIFVQLDCFLAVVHQTCVRGALVAVFERVALVARSLLGSNGSILESKRSSHVLVGFERDHSREHPFVVRSIGVRTSLHKKSAFVERSSMRSNATVI